MGVYTARASLHGPSDRAAIFRLILEIRVHADPQALGIRLAQQAAERKHEPDARHHSAETRTDSRLDHPLEWIGVTAPGFRRIRRRRGELDRTDRVVRGPEVEPA